MRSLATLSLVSVLALTAQAHAQQTLDQATADQLALEMNNALNEAIAPYKDSVTVEGSIKASTTTDAYVMAAPAMTVTLPNDFKLKLPATSVTMRPVGTDSYTYEGSFPAPINVLDDKGVQTGQITVDKQRLTGAWKRGVPGSAAFPATDVKLSGLLYKDATGVELSKITNLSLNTTAALTENSKMSESLVLKVNELIARDQSGMKAITINEFALESYLSDADAASMDAMRKKSAEMRASLDAATTGAPADPSKTASAMENVSGFFGDFAKLGGSSLLKLRISNLNYLDKSTARQKTFKVSTLALGGEVKSNPQKPGMVDYSTIYKHSGLEISPPPSQQLADFLPKILSLNFTVENLPMADLLNVGVGAIANSSKAMAEGTAPAPGEANRDFSSKVMDTVAKAQTRFQLKELAGMTNTMAASLSGEVKADAAAVYGGSGSFNGVIKGLDEYLAELKITLQAAQKAKDQQTLMENQGLFMGLTMLQGMGEPQAGSTPSSRRYNIGIQPDGMLTVNGAPMGGMGGGMGGGAPR